MTVAAGLSGPVRGILWMVASGMFYALIYVVVRGLSEIFPVNQIVFFRAILGSVFMMPWIAAVGVSALRTSQMRLYLWRMAFSYIGAVAWMYGIAGMPLADANALMFTMPLFTIVLAAIWLAERPGVHRIGATVVGFAGALIILRPGMIEISLPALATLFAAASFSAALVGTKKLTATENPNAMVFYLYTLMIPLSAIAAYFDWHNPSVADIPLLLALGVCTVGAQQCQTRAFKAAQASLVVIVNYVQLPIIALLAWLIFEQSTDSWTWLGAAVICASTYYVSYRESRARTRKTGGSSASPPHWR
ncbi:MAG: DMT family transporter [Alphaproteobacteria bacterium]